MTPLTQPPDPGFFDKLKTTSQKETWRKFEWRMKW
jgi:hypothetical protein